MNWQSTPAAASNPGTDVPAGQETPTSPSGAPVHITRTSLEADASGQVPEVFRLTLDQETISLLPQRNWGQLDIHKWVARGKLPSSPAGLEVTADHVKVAGETVTIKDPEGCEKLERAFNTWLLAEKEASKVIQRPHVRPAQEAPDPASQALHYKVEVDKGGQVHIRCVRGREVLASIGLNTSGFKSLVTQGLLRKPHSLQVGALHDWIELDGAFFSFEQGKNESSKLEELLNRNYLPLISVGSGKDVVVYANPASSTGYDIQFPATVGGVPDNHKRPLNEDTLELLLDPVKCGLLQPGLVIRLTRPNLIFKMKTADGGERYLEKGPQNCVHVCDDDGNETIIDLSRPVNYTPLSTMELTAVFNHPSIHKHGKASSRAPGAVAPAQVSGAQPQPDAAAASSNGAKPVPIRIPVPTDSTSAAAAPPAKPLQQTQPPAAPPVRVVVPPPASPKPAPAPVTPAKAPEAEPPRPTVNAWLSEALGKSVMRHEWFACLVYTAVARHYGNSSSGVLGISKCWYAAADDVRDIGNPAFKGFFLTEKSGFGFLNSGRLAKFGKGVAFLGQMDAAVEGIGVGLIGVGIDAPGNVCFVVSPDYRKKFGVPEPAVAQEVRRLAESGVRIVTAEEVLTSQTPVKVYWTVPAEYDGTKEPEALELTPPGRE